MKKFTLLLFFVFSIALSAQETVVMNGKANDKDNKLVYTEVHTFTRLPGGEISAIKTVYTNAEGSVIASVDSNFSKDPFIPDTVFIDKRFNEKQELSYDKDKKIITMKITDSKGKIKTNTLPRTENMVSGQGFHNYILKHFDDSKSEIKFIVLPKMDYYSFYFERQASSIPGQRRFVLKISSWVLRALVKEIVVEYREKDKALMLFDGLTNIDSDKRDSQILKIEMSYPGEKK